MRLSGVNGQVPSDFLSALGALAVADKVSPGTTLQFHENGAAELRHNHASDDDFRTDFDNELRAVIAALADENNNKLVREHCTPPVDKWVEAQLDDWSTAPSVTPWSLTRLVDPTRPGGDKDKYASADLVLYSGGASIASLAKDAEQLVSDVSEISGSLIDNISFRLLSKSLWRYTASAEMSVRNGVGEATGVLAPVGEVLALLGAAMYHPRLSRQGGKKHFQWRLWYIPVGLLGVSHLIKNSAYLDGEMAIPSSCKFVANIVSVAKGDSRFGVTRVGGKDGDD